MKSTARSARRLVLSGLAVAMCAVLAEAAAQQALPARLPAGTPVSDDLTALLADVRAVSPADQGIMVHAQDIQIGHLEISFEDGSLFPLRTPKGMTFGFYFAGTGRYSYTSEDPGDRGVLARNVGHETRAEILDNHTVRDTFKRLVVYFAVPQFEDLWSGATPTATPSGTGVVSIGADRSSEFKHIWKRIQQSYLPYDHLAATALLNGSPRQYVYAEFEGGAETAGYSYDLIDQFEERYCLFRKVQGIDYRWYRTLSHQPIEGGRSEHAGDLTLRDIHIDVSTEDNRSARINSDLTLTAGADGVRVARLDLVNNRDPDHVNWESTKNRLTILRVVDDGGRALPFSHRYYDVIVQLPNPLERGQEQRLRFETQGDILTDWHGHRYDNFFGLMYDAWYPRPGWNSAGFSSSLKIRTRAPFLPVASGRLVAHRDEGGFHELETSTPETAEGPVVFAGKYKTREAEADGVTIRSNAYADAIEEVQERMLRVTAQFLRFYQQSLGPYPFGKIDIIQIPTSIQENGWIAFGVAPPGLVLMSSEAYNPYKVAATPLNRGVDGRLAHEIAHHWFPHQARPATPREAWLSESFAEYPSGLAMGAARPDESQVEGFPQQFAQWRARARECKEIVSLEMAALLAGPNVRNDYECLVYNRGPLVLHMLRTLVGNDRFFAILRAFLERGKAGPVTTEDFRRSAEAVMQVDMGWFFDQWVKQPGIPDIRLKYAVERRGDTFVLAGRAEQVDSASFKKIHIPFVLDMGGGHSELRLLFQDKPIMDFSFDLPGKPRKVTVDPAQNNLAVYH